MRDGDGCTIRVAQGLVRGESIGAVRRFLGIAYAAPPIGPLRFQPPVPPPAWDGIRDARRPGPSYPQRLKPFPNLDVLPLVDGGQVAGDDYLTLNVWAPTVGEALPVMVWIHGGGFVVGSKDAPISDGTSFARDGIICVAINYRMGVDGFLPIRGIPTNLGLRDMIAALRWVRENIGAFG